jgi:exodeoxyribonuclease VIII
MRLGRALHCMVLTPQEYRSSFLVAPKVDRRTKAGKAEFAHFESLAGSRTILKTEEAEQLDAMVAAININTSVRDALHQCEQREVSVFAELSGVQCKGRLDAIGDETVLDLKTTSSTAGPQDVQSTIWKYGYGLQMAFYRRLLRANGMDPSRFLLAFVESSAPHAVAVYDLETEVMDIHEARIDNLLTQWSVTLDVGESPAWPDHIRTIGVPNWARAELELETEEASILQGDAA